LRRTALKICFIVTVLLYCLSAATPIFVPFAIDASGDMNILGYVAGGVFWAGLLLGSILYLVLILITRPKRRGRRKKGIPSQLRFFGSTASKITDSVFLVGLCGTIYGYVSKTDQQAIIVIFLVLLLIGIYTHFLVNGKVYQNIYNSKSSNKLTK